MIVATTDRLLLRTFTPEDAPAFMELTNEPEVRRYTGVEPYASVSEAAAMIDTLLERYERDGFGRWVVERRSDQVFLGWCGLRALEREGVDLGFWILPRHWRNGYATEAAIASASLAFGRYRLPYLLGRYVAENVASGTVLAKLGFAPWLRTSGHGYDDVRYTILPSPALPVADPALDVVCSCAGLSARRLQPADQLDFFRLEGNPNVLRYADGELISFEQAGEAIDGLRRSSSPDSASSASELHVLAVSAHGLPFVGTVATVDEGDRVEIGYRLLESCWGQGLGRPIAALALAVARQGFPGRTVYARCDLRNAASLRVLEGLDGARRPNREGHAIWEW